MNNRFYNSSIITPMPSFFNRATDFEQMAEEQTNDTFNLASTLCICLAISTIFVASF